MSSAATAIGTGHSSEAASVGKLVAWVFGFAPVLLFVLTWSEDLSDLQRMARAYALPVVGIELMVIFISFHRGIRLSKPRPVQLVLLGTFGLLVWTTAVMAASAPTALLRTGIWTVHLFFALAIFNLWRLGMLNLEHHLKAILWGFLAFFALLTAFVATTVQTGQERIFDLPAFSSIRWFGYYSAAVIGLCAAGFLRRNRFALLVASLAFAMAFWTGSRGAIAAALVGFAACTFLFREFRSFRPWLLFGLCGLAGFALAIGLDTVVPMGNQGPDSMARHDDSGRTEVWWATIELIKARPWFGYGDGQFQLSIARTMTIAQPHNLVLQVLHAWGAVGAALGLALVASLAPAFLKGSNFETAPFECGALILAAYAFIDGALFYNQSLSLFAFCCAAAFVARAPGHPRTRVADDPDEAIAATAADHTASAAP